jgi:hypothetical protein
MLLWHTANIPDIYHFLERNLQPGPRSKRIYEVKITFCCFLDSLQQCQVFFVWVLALFTHKNKEYKHPGRHTWSGQVLPQWCWIVLCLSPQWCLFFVFSLQNFVLFIAQNSEFWKLLELGDTYTFLIQKWVQLWNEESAQCNCPCTNTIAQCPMFLISSDDGGWSLVGLL